MTVVEMTGLAVALLVMLIGLFGSVVPGLPGVPLVLAAAVGHWLIFGPHSVSGAVLFGMTAATAVALLLDYAASMLGARRFGATWRGVTGAAVGGVVGLFFNLPGIILGPFVGATLFEMVGGHKFKDASRAGLGATVGLFVGVLAKCAICAAMIGVFVVNVLQRSLS
jgi:uncharacterized protein YqgC (DUF456 family)